jgi:hypothetical protein
MCLYCGISGKYVITRMVLSWESCRTVARAVQIVELVLTTTTLALLGSHIVVIKDYSRDIIGDGQACGTVGDDGWKQTCATGLLDRDTEIDGFAGSRSCDAKAVARA